jgi:energy-coupling factor transporter transmembrane protein EcfT
MKTSSYIKTVILAVIVLFFTVQKDYGPLALMLFFIFIFVLLYNLIQMARKPAERKLRGIRMAIWLVVLSVAMAVQSHRANGTKEEADKAVKTVLDYKARTGAYPAGLKDAGLDEVALERDWEIRYFMRDGKPVLVYSDTFMPLTTNDYDFDKRAWHQNSY